MLNLPPPTTFAEGERLLYGRLAAGAGMFCGATAIALILLLAIRHWPAAELHTIILLLGGSLGGFIIGMMVVIIGLLVGGPVGRFKGEVDVGANKVAVEADGGTNGAN